MNYFCNKYDIKKRDIDVISNNLYNKDKRCLHYCGENILKIKYNNEEYDIRYNEKEDIWGDTYQVQQIENDLYNYYKNGFPIIGDIKIENLANSVSRTTDKYNGNIKEYMKNMYMKDGFKFSNIRIWIPAVDAEQAKQIKKEHAMLIIDELAEMNINYYLTISELINSNSSSAFYSFGLSNNAAHFTNNVAKCRSNTSVEGLKDDSCVNKE